LIDILLVFHRLSYYEEAAGVLEEIIRQEDALAVRIGKIHLALPLDMVVCRIFCKIAGPVIPQVNPYPWINTF
jgi:hypothetical protein